MLNFGLGRVLYKPLIAATTALITSISATADDLEVFDAMLNSQNLPNILFVLDYSGSMGQDIYGNYPTDTTTPTKSDILVAAVNNLLENNKGKVNVGIGAIYDEYTTGVRWPISDLLENANTFDPDIPVDADIAVADVIAKELERRTPGSGTGTVNGLVEAAAYFRGDDVLHNGFDVNQPDLHKPDQWNVATQQYEGGHEFAAIPSSYSPSDAYDFSNDTWVTPQYVSPLTNQCQANFIVLISDGRPTRQRDTQTLSTVLNAAGINAVSECEDLSTSVFADATRTYGNCGPEILEYLATTNLNPDIENTHVNTFTIGFGVEGVGKDYLELLAQSGGGAFYNASEPAALTDALNDIIDSILVDSNNFTELSIDIDPSTFSHSDRAYFSLFSPSQRPGWRGNMKGYFVDDTGLIDITGESATEITDSGITLTETAQSFWSSTPDGNDIMLGGASETITEMQDGPNNRNLFTFLDGQTKTMLSNNFENIANDKMGVATDAERLEALTWLANAPMGDPLHTKPVVVLYEDSGVKTNVAYVMTNQGLLHAFDATTPLEPNATTPDTSGGNELFAFMPEELLPNIPKLYTSNSEDGHIYGLDGPVTRWHNDNNRDGMVNGDDTVQLIFAMRRGGNSYYSLDITDPTQPDLKWQISKGDEGFEDLAQTWSRASLITVRYDVVDENDDYKEKRVLMFAGGYDADVVDNTVKPTEAGGNAVYMVDENGSLVWSIDETDHKDFDYSIPSDLTIIDSDNNGAADQVWRVDFNDIDNNADTVLTQLADVKEFKGHQPIFYAPSVSSNTQYGERYTAVAFGTGDRTQPLLDNSSNAFFMIKDMDYKAGPPATTPGPITRATIYDATSNNIGSPIESVQDEAREDMKNASGWMVSLNPGEKALSKVVTFNGKFLATTFEPDEAVDEFGVPDPCKFAMFGRLYVMDINDAKPVKLMDDGSESTEGLGKNDRITDLNSSSIPSKPVVIIPADGSQAQIFVDKESVVAVNKQISTVFWHAK